MPFFKRSPERIHGIRVIEGGGGAQRFNGLRLIFRNALAIEQAMSEGGVGVGLSSGCSLLKPGRCGGKIGRVVSEAVGHHRPGLGRGLGLSLSGSSKPF